MGFCQKEKSLPQEAFLPEVLSRKKEMEVCFITPISERKILTPLSFTCKRYSSRTKLQNNLMEGPFLPVHSEQLRNQEYRILGSGRRASLSDVTRSRVSLI